ncbi:uncharacterized protein [Pseudochaenichthys georgianus]|uniref:uncharacterized protein n=1 Tax=Pseudochaenichthys georgianus TaxID=52239 RepID=UPI0039C1854B
MMSSLQNVSGTNHRQAQGITDTSQRRLNETFTASEEQPSVYTFSPSRPSFPAAGASLDASLRSRRHSVSAHPPQTDGCSVYASDPPSVKERLDGAPVRKRSLEARRVTDLRPPHASSRSCSREPTKPRLLSTPPHKLTVPLRMRHPQDPHISPHRQLRSAQSASAAKRLRPNLSSDSSLPSVRAPYPPKKLDEDFLKVYHKFVCQNKSGFLPPLCEKLSGQHKLGPGSSRPVAAPPLGVRKRDGEFNVDAQSKRHRDE